jgi:phosphoribosylformylglycinamidine synthase
MKTGVVVFPGSNCDRDAVTAIQSLLRGDWGIPAQGEVRKLWHAESSLPKLDLIVIPGGFSYGDYLRTGAMAAHSPILRAVKAHAAEGRLVLGICNGFQILTEAGLLPGTLLRNNGLSFLCRSVHLRVENAALPFTRNYSAGQVVRIPIAHHDGNYFADAETLDRLEGEQRVAFRYCDIAGDATEAANPNGSQRNIAGITNAAGTVLGMMPHPERVCDPLAGGMDGRALFAGLLAA